MISDRFVKISRSPLETAKSRAPNGAAAIGVHHARAPLQRAS